MINPKDNKMTFIMILSVFLILNSLGLSIKARDISRQEEAITWDKIKELVDNFLINPDKRTAQPLYNLLSPENNLLKEQPKLFEHLFNYLVSEKESSEILNLCRKHYRCYVGL